MPRIVENDYTFVTNNAVDFRKLHGNLDVHAGLVIIVPQVPPDIQRRLFDTWLRSLAPDEVFINEAVEIVIEDGEVVFERYDLPE